MIYIIQTGASIDAKYAAESEIAALRQYADDAHYKSYEDLKDQHGPVDSIKEVSINELSDAELIDILGGIKGWFQKDTAKALGYGNKSRISDIVNGKQKMSGPARKFAEHLLKKCT